MTSVWNRASLIVAATALSACKSSKTADAPAAIPETPPSASASNGPSGSSGSKWDDSAAPATHEVAANSAHPAASGSRHHVVKKGDTLFSLAREYYNGDASKWRRIWDANRDKLSDRDTIKVGQELVIPD